MRKLRVVLVNIGRRTLDFPFTSPPMGVLYLAAYLRTKFPLEVRVIAQRVEDYTEDEVVRQVVDFEPDVVGFSARTVCGCALRELVRQVRQARPEAFVVIGGPHASACREGALRDTQADAAVVGEGELSLEALIHARFDGQDIAAIPGLIWKTPDGQVVTNPGQMPFIEDLDSLPFPAYDLVDLPKYWKTKSITPIPRHRYVSLVSSRGCPYCCIWCHTIFGKRFRAHCPERVADEIEYFTRHYGINDVEFLDDVFNMDRDRVVSLCEEVRRRNLTVRIALSNGIRTDVLTQEVVDAMADAGLYYSGVALETGSPRLQELTGKRLNIPRFLDGVRMLDRKGVFIYGFAMLGHPTETESEMQKTIDTLTHSQAHIASFFTQTPFPGTALYEMAKARSPERLEAIKYDGANFADIHVNLSDVPDDVLFEYQRKAYRTFYLNPRRIVRILRHYPRPLELATYLPVLLDRMTKGLLH
jgi:radical SAM superfamily enzyme YgiQ (UPF0313 family)